MKTFQPMITVLLLFISACSEGDKVQPEWWELVEHTDRFTGDYSCNVQAINADPYVRSMILHRSMRDDSETPVLTLRFSRDVEEALLRSAREMQSECLAVESPRYCELSDLTSTWLVRFPNESISTSADEEKTAELGFLVGSVDSPVHLFGGFPKHEHMGMIDITPDTLGIGSFSYFEFRLKVQSVQKIDGRRRSIDVMDGLVPVEQLDKGIILVDICEEKKKIERG